MLSNLLGLIGSMRKSEPLLNIALTETRLSHVAGLPD